MNKFGTIRNDIARLLGMAMLFVAIQGLTAGVGFASPQEDSFIEEQLGFGNEFGAPQEKIALEAEFRLQPDSKMGVLSIRADVLQGWHIFSLTQPKGGPMQSQLSIAESPKYKLTGKFSSNPAPHREMSPIFKLMVEEHEGQVVWKAPIELAEDTDHESLTIEVVYNGQACESKPGGVCVPIFNKTVEAKFAGFDESVKVVKEEKIELIPFVFDGLHASVKGKISKSDEGPITAGDTVKLLITAKSTDDYHLYMYGLPGEERSYTPTLITFEDAKAWKLKGPERSEEPKLDVSLGEGFEAWSHHDVTWTFEFVVPEDAKEGQSKKLTGNMLIQTCDESGCDPPMDLAFEVELPVGKKRAAAVKFTPGKPGAANKGQIAVPPKNMEPKREAKSEAESTTNSKEEIKVVVDSEDDIEEMATYYKVDEKIKYLTMADMATTPIGAGKSSSAQQISLYTAVFGMFVGGMLLNLMPCVFPVLGLKVMGFVKQGGEDQAKVRAHGLLFGLGLVVSMWMLAGALLVFREVSGENINWGAQMGNPYFVGFMIVLLFLLALNMAGIFEFGTSLSGVGGSVTSKGGYFSSFMSGVLTTLIATPCSGPFLGTAMTYTFSQPAVVSMLLFTVFGIGIAIPYIVLSFFPPLIKRLPKPGPWMDTFKVTMAFALFATVAFFMRTFGALTGTEGLYWLVMALVVIGMAAYFYGQFGEPHIKAFKRYTFGYGMPLIVAAIGFWMTYDASAQGLKLVKNQGSVATEGELHWTQWHPGKVEYIVAKKKRVVWVDYTANW